MTAYGITYKIRNKNQLHSALIEARDMKSAKRKIGKKHGYKDGRMIQVLSVCIAGYL